MYISRPTALMFDRDVRAILQEHGVMIVTSQERITLEDAFIENVSPLLAVIDKQVEPQDPSNRLIKGTVRIDTFERICHEVGGLMEKSLAVSLDDEQKLKVAIALRDLISKQGYEVF